MNSKTKHATCTTSVRIPYTMDWKPCPKPQHADGLCSRHLFVKRANSVRNLQNRLAR